MDVALGGGGVGGGLISAFAATTPPRGEKDALKPSDTKQFNGVDQSWAFLVLLTSLFFELVS